MFLLQPRIAAVLACLTLWNCRAFPGAAAPPPTSARPGLDESIALRGSLDQTLSPMRALIDRYAVDRASLRRFYDGPLGRGRGERVREFHQGWLDTLGALDFDTLDQDGRIDYVLFRNQLEHELRALEHERRKLAEIESLIPFADPIIGLHEARRQMQPIDPAQTASLLADLTVQLQTTRQRLEEDPESAAGPDGAEPAGFKATAANRAAQMIDRLRDTLRRWYRFYDGYDPLFTWWVEEPYEQLEKALGDYAGFVRQKLAGIEGDEDEAIIGDPIGRDELLRLLAHEMIPYPPEELLEIAQREFEWCRREMLRASEELGFGDDWRQALDHVKTLHVGPGRQPELIRELAWEAVRFLEDRDLLTIPELCRETWRMEMMSPERQKVSPYFLGGEVIMVSFPTAGMAHEDKLMSMRGNNIHFARATVHHELIPGHHLQGFMTQRHRSHRRVFSTPFWGEGWALYWEMLLWDLDFPQSPENRIGMLFWRTHRCARIVFSLSFHLEEMTPQEAIEYLIENVGHERNNATAEVRRSVSGAYGPLYQAAYMLGGLQFRALRRELVESGRMSDREFHDAILRQGSIPVEMVRAALIDQPLTPDYVTRWKFDGGIEDRR